MYHQCRDDIKDTSVMFWSIDSCISDETCGRIPMWLEVRWKYCRDKYYTLDNCSKQSRLGEVYCRHSCIRTWWLDCSGAVHIRLDKIDDSGCYPWTAAIGPWYLAQPYPCQSEWPVVYVPGPIAWLRAMRVVVGRPYLLYRHWTPTRFSVVFQIVEFVRS